MVLIQLATVDDETFLCGFTGDTRDRGAKRSSPAKVLPQELYKHDGMLYMHHHLPNLEINVFDIKKGAMLLPFEQIVVLVALSPSA